MELCEFEQSKRADLILTCEVVHNGYDTGHTMRGLIIYISLQYFLLGLQCEGRGHCNDDIEVSCEVF